MDIVKNLTKTIQDQLSQFPGAKLTSIVERNQPKGSGRVEALVDAGTTDLIKISQIFQVVAGVLVKAGYSQMMWMESDWTELNLVAVKP